jgi:hypothetical protein
VREGALQKNHYISREEKEEKEVEEAKRRRG